MTQKNHRKEAMQNPEELYNSPDDVLNDKGLSNDEKLSVLENWANDVQQILIAETENMCPDENSTREETLLQKITDCIRTVKK